MSEISNASPTESQTEMLVLLEELAGQRLRVIADAPRRRQIALDHYKEEVRQISAHHQRANRALVDTVEHARKMGIPKLAICKCIGITPQRLHQIRNAVVANEQETKVTNA